MISTMMTNIRILAALIVGTALAAPVSAVEQLHERRLHLSSVEASSFLFNDWNKFQENYHPLYLGDDDPSTAWVEGKPGPGVGEWVRLHVTTMHGANRVRLRLRNGYQKSQHLFEANTRAKVVTITLLPSKVTVQRELADQMGWQEVVVDQPAGDLSGVELRIDSVYAGKKYEDLCLSDAQLLVTATSADNPAFERERFQKILDWKKERLQAAQLFKQETARTLPIAPQYRAEKGPQPFDDRKPECKWDDEICWLRSSLAHLAADSGAAAARPRLEALRALLDQAQTSFAAVQAVPLDKRILPPVDGLCRASLNSCEADCEDGLLMPMLPQAGWLSANQLGVFDVKPASTIRDALKKHPAVCKGPDHGAYVAWAHRGEPRDGKARMDAVVVMRCGDVESREGMAPAELLQLIAYDDDGRIAVIADRLHASLLRWANDGGRAVLAGGRQVDRADAALEVTRAGELAAR
jgi:hypothetical protein